MKVLEFVPGEILVVEVPSRSGGDPHRVSIVYDGPDIKEVGCTCLGWKWNKRCWAIEAAMRLSGRHEFSRPSVSDGATA